VSSGVQTKNIFSNSTLNGFIISLLLHAVVIGCLVYVYTKPNPAIELSPMVTMEIADLEPATEQTKQPKEKEIQEPKKVEPTSQKPEPVTKEPKEPKEIKKEVAKPQEPREIHKQTKEVSAKEQPKEAVKEKTEAEPKETKEEYRKTNFEVIRSKVKSRLKCTTMANKMQWSGTVTVLLTISPSGNLIDVVLLESSGKPQLDEIALRGARAIGGESLPKPSETSDIRLPIKMSCGE